MPNMITRCPKCATAFRISDTLLNTAKGMVRCGSCLNVFNAINHLDGKTAPPASGSLSTPDLQAKTGSNLQTSPPAPASSAIAGRAPPDTVKPHSSPISISGFLRQQDVAPTTQVALHDLAIQPPDSAKPEHDAVSGGLFERPWAGQPTKLSKKEEPDSDTDESWALELLKDDGDENVAQPIEVAKSNPAELKKIPEVQATSAVAPSQEKNLSIENEKLAKSNDFVDASPVSTAIGIDTSNSKQEPPSTNAPPESRSIPLSPLTPDSELQTSPPSLSTAVTEIVPPTNSAALAAIDATSPSSQPTWTEPQKPEDSVFEPEKDGVSIAKDSTFAHGATLRDAIAAIEPEPLELAWKQEISLSRRLLWPALSLVALLLLLAQVAWLEFHRLNRIEPYRSFYAMACQTLSCTLPDLIDRSKIQAYNLVVRSHPEAANALIMDVILQNNAPFEQSFPVLLLTFSSIENETIASRRLTPDEYLGGEMAGVENMPMKQPIHIAIEIVDPGADAPNYSITITD